MLKIFFDVVSILPIKENNVFIGSNKGAKISGNLKFIYEELKKDAKYDIKIYMDKPNRNMSETLGLYYAMARAKYILLDDYYRQQYGLKFKKGVEVVQVWHACGAFKKFGFSSIGKGDGNTVQFETRAHQSYTKVVASSKYIIPQYANAFNVSEDKVIPIGVPRTDILLDESYKKEKQNEFEKAYPNAKDKKVILYAPTFRGNANKRRNFKVELNAEEILKNISEDYVIVFKLHPTVKTGLDKLNISKEIQDRVIFMDSSMDVNDLIIVSDIVVTDYSSVVFEAALLDKKILMYAYDKEEYLGERDFYFEYDSFVPGPIAKNNEEIIEIINENKFDLNKVEEFKNKFFEECNGKATQKFIKTIFK